MIIVENADGKFYIPEEIASNPEATVKELSEAAIPFEEYEKNEKIKSLKSLIQKETPTNKILIAWAKDNHPDMQAVKQYKLELESLMR
jgi:hypothetical protein